jgi:dTDP-4-amino-4,6-dideoxygalactose transaminase
LPALHLYAVLIDFPSFGLTRAAFMRQLAEEGIGSQVHYFPVHRQRYYAERYGIAQLPGADRYYARVLSLPFFASMNEDDVERVVHAMAKILDL